MSRSTKFDYERVPRPVHAVRWTGDNRAEIEEFFDGYQELTDIGLWFSADEESGEPGDNYNMVQFTLWGDDQEVDPGWWIVRFLPEGEEEDYGVIMSDDGFRGDFRRPSAHHV